MSKTEISELYQELIKNEFDFVQRRTHSLASIYEIVKTNYPELCDDTFLCLENCSSGNNSPEWQHAVRRALNELKRRKSTEIINNQRGYYMFVGNQIPPIASNINELATVTQLSEVVYELNIRSENHHIRELQEFRKENKGLEKVPTRHIFSSNVISDEWAFHRGGRKELQFNIGFEVVENIKMLRHGVAFSFETSQALYDINILIPKVKFFNDFIRDNPEEFSDMRMWYWQGERSIDFMPSAIPHEIVKEGVFVFLGKRQAVSKIDYELILDDFDRLFPLYKYVESNGKLETIPRKTSISMFQPGRSIKKSSTTATLVQQKLDINLRHNEIQQTLSQKLIDHWGEENIREEYPVSTGSKVDIAVRGEDGLWFFEIKTAVSTRLCIRQALGQLLEYAYWPGSPVVKKLVIVGESPLDDEGNEYLETLQHKFGLPIEYEQVMA
jgi:hypothetical protein